MSRVGFRETRHYDDVFRLYPISLNETLILMECIITLCICMYMCMFACVCIVIYIWLIILKWFVFWFIPFLDRFCPLCSGVLLKIANLGDKFLDFPVRYFDMSRTTFV